MPGNPTTDPKWAAELADTIERTVGTVRHKTTRPLLLVYRGVIFGIVAVFGAMVALVALIIALVRAFQAFLELFVDHADAVWISYLIVGVIFTVAGLIVMKNRFPTEANMDEL